MVLISNVEHSLATAAQDMVKAAKFVEHQVLPALQKAQANAGTIEAITALVSPDAANVERVAFAVLGLVIKAIQDGSEAANAGGMNIMLDAALVEDLRKIAPGIQAAAALKPAPR